jgi:hypothetical protein
VIFINCVGGPLPFVQEVFFNFPLFLLGAPWITSLGGWTEPRWEWIVIYTFDLILILAVVHVVRMIGWLITSLWSKRKVR